MKYVYASKTGHVEKIVNKLGLDALKIADGTENIDGDFIIVNDIKKCRLL